MMYADDRTRERMRRKTIQRLDNESKKDTARRASLEAADIVWKSCYMSFKDMSDRDQSDFSSNNFHNAYSLTESGSTGKAVMGLNALEYWSDDDDDNEVYNVRRAATGIGGSRIEENTTIDNDETESRDNTLVGRRNMTSNRNSSKRKYTNFKSNSVSIMRSSDGSRLDAQSEITSKTIMNGSTSVETAAQRGWNRGSQELNESLLLPHASQDDIDLPSITNGVGDNDSLTTMPSLKTETAENPAYHNIGSNEFVRQSPSSHGANQKTTESKKNVATNKSWWNILTKTTPDILAANSNEETLVARNPQDKRFDGNKRRRKPWFGGSSTNDMKSYVKTANGKRSIEASSRDAWMCGVCGMAFSTEISAEKHEWDHIEQLIYKMGYSLNQSSNMNNVISSSDENNFDATPVKSNVQSKMTNGRQVQHQRRGNNDIMDQMNSTSHFNDNITNHETTTASKHAVHEKKEAHPSLVQQQPKKSSFRKGTGNSSIKVQDSFPGIEADIPDLPASDMLIPRIRSQISMDETDPISYPPPLIFRNRKSSTDSADQALGHNSSDLFKSTRHRSNSEVHFADDNLDTIHFIPDESKDDLNDEMQVDTLNHTLTNSSDDDVLLISTEIRNCVLRPDEALVNVILRAEALILTKAEREAEYELSLLAKDKRYYDEVWSKAAARIINPSSRYRSDEKHIVGKIQNKLLDAYQLMKESDGKHGGMIYDQYNRKKKRRKGNGLEVDDDDNKTMSHVRSTLYVNVMVKNSVKVVQYELQRLAKQRWESTQQNNMNTTGQDESKNSKFERFRGIAQTNMIKLAGLALASDFTPRRIAIQMSNDLYRLLTPRLKRRGVIIETEIEYRVGPYFVLAINIESIDWRRLIRAVHRDVELRDTRWKKALEEEESTEKQETQAKKTIFRCSMEFCNRLYNVSLFDILARMFALMFHLHWIVYLPLCWFAYYVVLGASIRQFIISSVTDEIFFYVEEKGMEMEIKICRSDNQAAFMLSALRELRADDKDFKKKQQETASQEKGNVLGPYLGPAIKADKGPPNKPDGFEVPPNLEFVGLELDLPVGFRRLRWAMLSYKSQFGLIFLQTEAKYDKIVIGEWDKFNDYIGEPSLPDSVNPNDFIGAVKEQEALMPKSAFVSANMSYEVATLIAYNDYCFCVKKKTRNPDAPFGNSFIAWTQILVVDMGNDSCHITCSVEPEFPNGPPMVANQIRSGMRAGTGEIFVLLGATITKYADEYP